MRDPGVAGASRSIAVDPQALASAAQAMAQARTPLGGAVRAVRDLGSDDLGSNPLDDALDEFGSRWRYGLEQITKHLDGAISGLQLAVTTYVETDQELARRAAVQSTAGPAGPAGP